MTRALEIGLLGDCEMRNSLKEKMLQHLHIPKSKVKGGQGQGQGVLSTPKKEEVEKRCSRCELPRLSPRTAISAATFASTFSTLEARSREWNVMDGVCLFCPFYPR